MHCSITCFPRACFCSLTPWLFRYTQNGILHMLDRNKRIKSKPERFQNCKDRFDLVVTCEERVYDQVVEGEASLIKCGFDWESESESVQQFCCYDHNLPEMLKFLSNLCWSSDLNSREQETLQPVHVINVDIQDNHEEATLGAFLICELCQCVSVSYQYFLSTVVHWRWRQAAVIMVWHVLLLLTLQIEHTEDMENEIEELLQEFEEKSKRPFLHTVCFYWRTSQTRNKPNQITISLWTHTHAPHSSVYSNVRKQLSCKHSIFRSGCQEWLLMDRMVGTPFPLLRGRTCCSAFLSPAQWQAEVILHPSHGTSPVISSGRTTKLTSLNLCLLRRSLMISEDRLTWCWFNSPDI